MTDPRPVTQFRLWPVINSRSLSNWEDAGVAGEHEMRGWRRLGFDWDDVAEWVDVARESARRDSQPDLEPGWEPTFCAGWVVAGFSAQEAAAWLRVLHQVPAEEMALVAREWRSAGFDADTAGRWSDRETVDSGVLLENGGWTPAERDLLDAWLSLSGIGNLPQHRTRLLASAAPPGHVLDYARAKIFADEVPYYERLRRDGRDVTDELRKRSHLRRQPDEMTAADIDRLRDLLAGARDGLHAEYLCPRAPSDMTHTALSPLPPGFPAPRFLSGAPYGSETWRRGYGEWAGYWPPEDSAEPPVLDWTDDHRELVLQAYDARWGTFLEEGQEYKISWPPRGSLWREGCARESWAELCSEHEDDYSDECEECEECEVRPEHVEPAEWHWYVTVETWERAGENSMALADTEKLHIMTTGMDPRQVEYSREVA